LGLNGNLKIGREDRITNFKPLIDANEAWAATTEFAAYWRWYVPRQEIEGGREFAQQEEIQ